jgi:hypothetical protein
MGYTIKNLREVDAAEEIYVVLAGSGRINLDGEIVELRPLDAIRVAPEVARAFEAGPDGLEILVFGPPTRATPRSSPQIPGRVELVEAPDQRYAAAVNTRKASGASQWFSWRRRPARYPSTAAEAASRWRSSTPRNVS